MPMKEIKKLLFLAEKIHLSKYERIWKCIYELKIKNKRVHWQQNLFENCDKQQIWKLKQINVFLII